MQQMRGFINKYRQKKCLPIADMPILKKSADIADADINIGTPLVAGHQNKAFSIITRWSLKTALKVKGGHHHYLNCASL